MHGDDRLECSASERKKRDILNAALVSALRAAAGKRGGRKKRNGCITTDTRGCKDPSEGRWKGEEEI